jgi:hypothetical protein
MSILNELKKMAKDNPNSFDLGEELKKYLSEHKTCCDKPENIKSFKDDNSHPYGLDVVGTRCRACGSLIDFEVIR